MSVASRVDGAASAPRESAPTPLRVKPIAAYLLALGLIAPTAIFKGSNLMLILLAAIVAMGGVSLVWSMIAIRRLEVRRFVPRWGEVGQPLRIRYRVRRRSRWLPSFGLQIREDAFPDLVDVQRPAWIVHIGPREEVHADARILPLRRGRLLLSKGYASTTFPFGCLRRKYTFDQPQHLVVYPRRRELRSGVIHATVADRMDGPQGGRHRGAGREWYGTRPSQGRDSLRDIAWKLSAHRDELICLDRAAPSPSRIRVLLDLRIPTEALVVADDQDARELEEQAIELAASIVQTAHQGGSEVGLLIPGLIHEATPIRNGSWHLHRLLGSLAGLDLDADRKAWSPQAGFDRSASIVVQVDRVRPLHEGVGSLYLTARQLDDLCVKPESGEVA